MYAEGQIIHSRGNSMLNNDTDGPFLITKTEMSTEELHVGLRGTWAVGAISSSTITVNHFRSALDVSRLLHVPRNINHEIGFRWRHLNNWWLFPRLGPGPHQRQNCFSTITRPGNNFHWVFSAHQKNQHCLSINWRLVSISEARRLMASTRNNQFFFWSAQGQKWTH